MNYAIYAKVVFSKDLEDAWCNTREEEFSSCSLEELCKSVRLYLEEPTHETWVVNRVLDYVVVDTNFGEIVASDTSAKLLDFLNIYLPMTERDVPDLRIDLILDKLSYDIREERRKKKQLAEERKLKEKKEVEERLKKQEEYKIYLKVKRELEALSSDK